MLGRWLETQNGLLLSQEAVPQIISRLTLVDPSSIALRFMGRQMLARVSKEPSLRSHRRGEGHEVINLQVEL